MVGGRVYRGSELPQLRGRYVFGDWSTSFGQPDGTLLVAKPRPDRYDERRITEFVEALRGRYNHGWTTAADCPGTGRPQSLTVQ